MSELAELRAQFGSLRSEDVAALDRAAVAGGVTVMQLMEVAGLQVARCAWKLLLDEPGPVTVVAGRGNNGGDGLVAARFLATWGLEVTACVFSESDELEGLLAQHAWSAQQSGVSIRIMTSADDVAADLSNAALVLDGMLGMGLRSSPREPQAAVIRVLNDSGARVLAIDVPSGLDATTGDVFAPCIRAAATCTLVAAKAGLWEREARAVSGELWVADIGMPRVAWQATGLQPPTRVRAGALLPVPAATQD